MVPHDVRRGHAGPGRGVAGDRLRCARAVVRADRLGQDPRRVPVGDRRARDRPDPARREGNVSSRPPSCTSHVAGTRRRRREEPAYRSGSMLAAQRLATDPSSGDAHPCRSATDGRGPLGRHWRRIAALSPIPRHPDHDPRVAVLIHERARDAAFRHHRDRRDPRRGRHQRGAHLAVSLGASTWSPTGHPNASGCPPTQRPLSEIAHFLGGNVVDPLGRRGRPRPVTIVDAASASPRHSGHRSGGRHGPRRDHRRVRW